MTKVNKTLIVLGIFIIISILYGLLLKTSVDKTMVRAHGGFLDLSGQSLSQKGSVYLSGEWAFYYKQFIDPHAGDITPDGYINVPKLWNSFVYEGKTIGAEAYGTYRLKVKLSRKEEIMGLKLPSMSSCYKLYVNGKFITQNGEPADSKIAEVPQWKPQIAFFSPDSQDLDIIVHVSNFHHVKGGMWGNILMGNQKDIIKYRDLSLMRSYLLFGILALVAIFMLSLSLVEKNFPCLYLGLFSLSSALREITVREVAIWNIVGDISFTVLPRLEYMTVPLFLLFYTLFIHRLYSQESVKIIYHTLLFASVFSIMLILFTDLSFFGRLVRFNMLNSLSVFLYSGFVATRSYLKGYPGSGAVLIGVIILSLAMINDSLYIEKISTYYGIAHIYTIAFSIFLISQLYVVFANISDNYTRARQTLEAQLLLLHSQIKPHFLFNILNTVVNSIDGTPSKSKLILQELGNYLRSKYKYSFNPKTAFVPLEEELDVIRSFVFLANTRLDDKITLNIDIEDTYLGYAIPEYILQPVVENSIKHGLDDGELKIYISAYEKGSDLIIKVRDDGSGMSKIALYNLFEDRPVYEDDVKGPGDIGIGLKNVRMRMKLYYNRDIEINSVKGRGTEVVFTIPLIKEVTNNYEEKLYV